MFRQPTCTFYCEYIQYQFELLRKSLTLSQTELIQFTDEDQQMALIAHYPALRTKGFLKFSRIRCLVNSFSKCKTYINSTASILLISAFRAFALPSSSTLTRLNLLLYNKKILLKCLTCHFLSAEKRYCKWEAPCNSYMQEQQLRQVSCFIVLYRTTQILILTHRQGIVLEQVHDVQCTHQYELSKKP